MSTTTEEHLGTVAKMSTAEFSTLVLSQLSQLAGSDAEPRWKLEAALRLLAKWRSTMIQYAVFRECGPVVQSGPFAGMTFVSRSVEGCHVPKLLGCYETELHDQIRAAAARGYDVVLNIGAAEGYYAIGMARLMESSHIYAYDTNSAAQKVCRYLAEANGVSERVTVGGELRGDDFARFEGRRTLVICDIEGGEETLLDPSMYPALKKMDLIVEIHGPSIRTAIAERFSPTHEIQFFTQKINGIALPPLFDQLGHLDQLLAIWEWRAGPTPWAALLARHHRK